MRQARSISVGKKLTLPGGKPRGHLVNRLRQLHIETNGFGGTSTSVLAGMINSKGGPLGIGSTTPLDAWNKSSSHIFNGRSTLNRSMVQSKTPKNMVSFVRKAGSRLFIP
jgi:hypothetical protein